MLPLWSGEKAGRAPGWEAGFSRSSPGKRLQRSFTSLTHGLAQGLNEVTWETRNTEQIRGQLPYRVVVYHSETPSDSSEG